MPELRTPVERLHRGDFVRAVEHGPIGRVDVEDRHGWMIVAYGKTRLVYKRGKDYLILVEAARSHER